MNTLLDKISINIKPRVLKKANKHNISNNDVENATKENLPRIIQKLIYANPNILNHKPQGLLYGQGFYCMWCLFKNKKNSETEYTLSVNHLAVE